MSGTRSSRRCGVRTRGSRLTRAERAGRRSWRSKKSFRLTAPRGSRFPRPRTRKVMDAVDLHSAPLPVSSASSRRMCRVVAWRPARDLLPAPHAPVHGSSGSPASVTGAAARRTGAVKVVLAVLHGEPRFVDLSPAGGLRDAARGGASPSAQSAPCTAPSRWRTRRSVSGAISSATLRMRKPELLATGPNQLWSWDITQALRPGEVDLLPPVRDPRAVFSRYVVGLDGWPHPRVGHAREETHRRNVRAPGHRPPAQLTIPRRPWLVDDVEDASGVPARRPWRHQDALAAVRLGRQPLQRGALQDLEVQTGDFPERFGKSKTRAVSAAASSAWYNDERITTSRWPCSHPPTCITVSSVSSASPSASACVLCGKPTLPIPSDSRAGVPP